MARWNSGRSEPGSPDPADVRVGIVSFQTAALLDRCLAALPAALAGLRAEVVVVDNASTDGSADVAATHAGVRVERNTTNVGYARAMNQALDGTPVPVLIALNPDTEPPPGSLRRLVEHLRERPDIAVLAPRLLEADGSIQHSVHRYPSIAVAAAANLLPVALLGGRLGARLCFEGAAPHGSGPVDWMIGAVHVLRAEATGTRPYSERWFMYVEDLELCWRMHRDGWGIALDVDVEVPHVGNAAGSKHWGSRRSRVVWQATYDFYADAAGTARARTYASLNAIGALVKGSFALVKGRIAGDAGARAWGRELLTVAPTHARAVLRPRATS